MAQRALGTQFFEQLLGLGKEFIGEVGAAEERSPRSRNLLFSQQNHTSSYVL